MFTPPSPPNQCWFQNSNTFATKMSVYSGHNIEKGAGGSRVLLKICIFATCLNTFENDCMFFGLIPMTLFYIQAVNGY